MSNMTAMTTSQELAKLPGNLPVKLTPGVIQNLNTVSVKKTVEAFGNQLPLLHLECLDNDGNGAWVFPGETENGEMKLRILFTWGEISIPLVWDTGLSQWAEKEPNNPVFSYV